MAAFYNREAEQKKIRRALARERRQFIVVYGRRRCGKSTLLRKIVNETEGTYYLASQSNQVLQRQALAATLSDRLPGLAQANFTSWEDMLRFIATSTKERFTLILDEFPYLVQSAPDLPSVINRYIDDRDERSFDLIVCGSSQQMMRGLVFAATAPLYGRADEIMKISPLAAGWLADHLSDNSPAQVVREFSVWGGVPRYWELRAEYDSFEEAIKALILDPTGIMREEPKRLLLDDMREVTQAISLLTVIALGANRMSEIAGRLNQPSTNLSRPLNRLIELGYVRREVPYGSPRANNKVSLYKVADPFIRFYFQMVYPFLSTIRPENLDPVYRRVVAAMPLFVSQEWEEICRTAIGLHPNLKPYGFAAGRWWGNGTNGRFFELDVVAKSADHKTLLVGECKWSDVKNPDKLQADLLEKAKTLPLYNGQDIIPVLTARSFVRRPDGLTFTPVDILNLLKY